MMSGLAKGVMRAGVRRSRFCNAPLPIQIVQHPLQMMLLSEAEDHRQADAGDLLAGTDLLEPGGSVFDVFAFSTFLALEGFVLPAVVADASGGLIFGLTPISDYQPVSQYLFGITMLAT